MLHPKLHINAIGGDAPGYSELDPNILHQVDRIVVEYLPQTRIEGEIQQIPFQMIEDKTFELHQIINKVQKGRVRADEMTLFDGVGFAISDYAILRMIFDLTQDYDFAKRSTWFLFTIKNKSLFRQLIDGKQWEHLKTIGFAGGRAAHDVDTALGPWYWSMHPELFSQMNIRLDWQDVIAYHTNERGIALFPELEKACLRLQTTSWIILEQYQSLIDFRRRPF